MDFFIAKSGQTTYQFNKGEFDEKTATEYLKNNGIRNFFFVFEPQEPEQLDAETVRFNGEIGFDITALKISKALNENKKIVLNSSGGSLLEGYNIRDTIEFINPKVDIGVIGICASATTVAIMGLQNSWASENSKFLAHAPWIIVQGNSTELKAYSQKLKEAEIDLANFYASHSGVDVKEWLALMSENKFISAQEASTKYSIVSKIKFNQKPSKMSEETKELKTVLEQAKSLFGSIFQAKAEKEEDEDLKKENATLKTEIEALKKKLAAFEEEEEEKKEAKAQLEESQVKVSNLIKQLEEIQSKVVIPTRDEVTARTTAPKEKNSFDVDRYNEIQKKLNTK